MSCQYVILMLNRDSLHNRVCGEVRRESFDNALANLGIAQTIDSTRR